MLSGRLFLVVVVLSPTILLAGLSCKDRIIEDWGTVVSGLVTDSITGQPLPGAKITLGDTLTYVPVVADSLGYYEFGELGGTLPMFCQKQGYLTQFREVHSTRSNPRLSDIDFRLVPIGE